MRALANKTGAIALIGFAALQLALIMMMCTVAFEAFIYPIIGADAEISRLLRDQVILDDDAYSAFRTGGMAAALLGLALFNTALMRSRAVGRAAPLLVFVGAILTPLGNISPWMGAAAIALFALGCFLMGRRLVREARSDREGVGAESGSPG